MCFEGMKFPPVQPPESSFNDSWVWVELFRMILMLQAPDGLKSCG